MLHALPAAASPVGAAPPVADTSAQCLFAPGVYAIMDSDGNLVGALIVYPDCRMEILAVE